MRSALRQALAGALFLPVAMTTLLVFLGYDPSPLTDVLRGAGSPLGVVLFALPLAFLGSSLALALRNDVWVSAYGTATVLVLAAVTGLFAGGAANRTLLSFAAAGATLSAAGSLALLVEALVRYRGLIRHTVAPDAFKRALEVGFAYTLALVGVRVGAYAARYGTDAVSAIFGMGSLGPLVFPWMVVGALALGTVPSYLLFRSHLVTPVVFVGTSSVYVTTTTLFDELTRSSVGAVAGASFMPVTGYLVGWVFLLGVATGLGLLEHAFRTRSGIYPPRPIRA